LGRKQSLAEEIDGLEDDDKLDVELAELKKKMNDNKTSGNTQSKSNS